MLFIETFDAASAWVKGGCSEPATVQGVDMTLLDEAIASHNLAGSAFLGCTLGERLHAHIRVCGAGLVTELSALPPSLPAFAPGIYTVADLYDGIEPDGEEWKKTPDYAGFFFFNKAANEPRELSPLATLAARIHDTVQEQATRTFLKGRKIIAIMGGHDFKRQLSEDETKAGKADVYWECVAIAKALTEKGFLILTGGGPGLMEAGNLGALLAGEPESTVADVRQILTNHRFDSAEWRKTGMAARARILGSWQTEPPLEKWSLGIPTWLYGHEPPNFFASHHSKMFFNSLREDGLVTWANKGIVFFEGNAGTVQEIFQDATQNYYLGKGQSPTPMVFYNAGGYWERAPNDQWWPTDVPAEKRKPLMPLIKQLASEKSFQKSVLVTSSPVVTVDFLVAAAAQPALHKADVNMGNAPTGV